jgi:predicted transcriptional regulator
MSTTTLGIKLDAETRARLKAVSTRLDRSSHWFMKKAILELIEKVEAGARIEDIVDIDLLEKDSLRHSIALRLRQDRCS